MAKIKALSILLEQEGKDYLKELYAKVIQNVEKGTISASLKNRDLSGDPEAGTVVAKRFANSQSREYGTARAAGKGKNIKAKDVTIPIDIDREIVEELEYKDIKLYGVDGVLDRRAVNHQRSMATELDYAFFAQGAKEGAYVTPAGDNLVEQLENLIVGLETVQSEYVRGVPRDIMNLVLDVNTYSKLTNMINLGEVANSGKALGMEAFGDFNGVRVYKSLTMPVGVKAMLMIDGAIAEPVMANPYGAEKIGLSEAYAVSLFYHYGCKVVTPDLIFVWADQVATPKSFPLETEFNVSQVVFLETSTPDADIFYTDDGTEPTEASTAYTEGGITISATTNIKAIAVKDGFTDSQVLDVTYTKL